MEAIILAGGLGTRLRPVVSEKPKAMAEINGKPFLEYQLDRFMAQGIDKFILSVGYKAEYIKDHFDTHYKNISIDYAIETKPLGTGGAIKNAMKYARGRHVLVANGDSLLISDIQKQYRFHLHQKANVTLALKEMYHYERYGTILTDADKKVRKFLEKKPTRKGLINAGLYIFDKKAFKATDLPDQFSIEKDYFENKINRIKIAGFETRGYFLDIGVPEDFKKAQTEIGVFSQIDKNWTLFLDRDGVINKKCENDYVRSKKDFKFLPWAVEAAKACSKIFGRTIIVTNQQGIGKGLMTEKDVKKIHQYMLQEIEKQGGKIDAVYYAPGIASENNTMRKPQTGMGEKAKKDFPEINFKQSIMIGDAESDIEFARRLGMHAVLITGDGKQDRSEERRVGRGWR